MLGTITKRKDGRYELKIVVNGVRKSFYGKSKFEVNSKYQKYLKEAPVSPQADNSLDENIEFWLKHYKYGKIKMSSYDALESKYVHHIKGTKLGLTKVSDITPANIQEFFDNKAFDTKHPISPNTLKRIRELLSGFFTYAEGYDIVRKNPMKLLKLPKHENMVKQIRVAEEIPEDVLQKLVEDYTSRWYNSAYVLLAFTGLRSGELLSLHWEDIDFKNRLLYVRRTMTTVKNREGYSLVAGRNTYETSTKTFSGKRVIPLNSTAIQMLEYMQEKHKNLNSIYVVCSNKGTPVNHRNFDRSFKNELKHLGSQDYTLHELRHTFGSRLLRRGVDIKVVSELLGHKNIEITYNTYIHILQEQKVKALSDIDIL